MEEEEETGDESALAREAEREAYHAVCEQLKLLRRKYDLLMKEHNELLWDKNVLSAAGLNLPGVEALEESSSRVSNGELNIELVKVIGRGAFSSVYLGRWPNGEQCAVKKISKSAAKSMVDLRNIATEYEALRTLSRGPCVLALHCAFASAWNIYFIMEFFGEELYKYLQKKSLPKEFGTAVIHGVANALTFMHDLGYAHRDVKSENVLVQGNVVKLCDLGLCAKLDGNPLRKCCGSMGFFAPDMLDPRGYSGAAVDVWSLGCLGIEVVAGNDFFETFWFDKYTTFFKRRGKSSTYVEFLDWMKPTVAELHDLVEASRGVGETAADDASIRAKLKNNSQVLSVVASCLRLEPDHRPRAFEIRDMLAACQAPDKPLLTPALNDVRTLANIDASAPPPGALRVENDDEAAPSSLVARLAQNLRRSFTPTTNPGGKDEHESPGSPTTRSSKFRRRRRVAPDRLGDDDGDLIARASSDFSSPRRGKVLVVDDSSVALHWICKAIERQFNCEVHTASSAIEALSLTEHNDYDAVLTDMIMPHETNPRLVSALRQREQKKANKKRLFICALTQLAEAFDVQRNADVDVVSRKPVNKALDLDFLRDCLTPRRLTTDGCAA
ncbi:hypothetical protein CTAYLR_005069 [Chrysophaeum taylorii]|uniref:Uncharacterized protein n=1 Tax=Chrysophaeum taylorii TaxID=2483200 RepID=A0AAD7U9R7_9STRA|nr:hypothetical protein CTAYLR_005069 [Chrysophaeum taylorii]